MANEPGKTDPGGATAGASGGMRSRIAEHFRFLRAMAQSPRRVGAVAPTSHEAAMLMAAPVDPGSDLPVLELGSGTGAITAAILERGLAPEKLYAVEYDANLASHLRQAFPGVNVINGNAFDLDRALADIEPAKFDMVVCGVPMLNFDQAERNRLLEDALSRVPPGRPMTQITYGTRPPVQPADPSVRAVPSRWVKRNIPPARIWTYSRPLD